MRAVVVAAWFGTRMLPVTKVVPKELIPVGDRPVLHWIVQDLAAAGVEDVTMIISPGKKSVIDYFSKNEVLEEFLTEKGKQEKLSLVRDSENLVEMNYVIQNKQRGTAHAVQQAQHEISEDFFLVIFGDAIYPPEMFGQILADFAEHRAPVIVTHEVPWDEVSRYGVVSHENGILRQLVEKPAREDAPSNLVSNGVYLLPRRIFEKIAVLEPDSKSGEFQLPTAILAMNEEIPFRVLQTRKMWDVGNFASRIEACAHRHANDGKLF